MYNKGYTIAQIADAMKYDLINLQAKPGYYKKDSGNDG